MTIQLEWGVKTSWRRYVLGLSDGRIDVGDGVELLSHSALFPLRDDCEWSSSVGKLQFGGYLTAQGHFGMALGHIIDPAVEYFGKIGQLTAVRWPGHEERIPIADLSGDPLEGPMNATLTLEGTEVFGGVYEAGTELDPLWLRLFEE